MSHDATSIQTFISSLPAIYHDEAEKPGTPLRAILELMCYNFNRIEKRIDFIERYFDTYTAPSDSHQDFLTWLGSWVDFEPDLHWSQQKKRFAVRQAADLYKYRGTITGLNYMITLFFGIEVEIREWNPTQPDQWIWPDGMTIGITDTIGEDTHLFEKFDEKNCFIVIWWPRPEEINPYYHMDPPSTANQQLHSALTPDQVLKITRQLILLISQNVHYIKPTLDINSDSQTINRIIAQVGGQLQAEEIISIYRDVVDKIKNVRNLIEKEKPVHTRCYFHISAVDHPVDSTPQAGERP